MTRLACLKNQTPNQQGRILAINCYCTSLFVIILLTGVCKALKYQTENPTEHMSLIIIKIFMILMHFSGFMLGISYIYWRRLERCRSEDYQDELARITLQTPIPSSMPTSCSEQV